MANFFDIELWVKKDLESLLTLRGEAVVRPRLASIGVTKFAKTTSGSGDRVGGRGGVQWGLGMVFMNGRGGEVVGVLSEEVLEDRV